MNIEWANAAYFTKSLLENASNQILPCQSKESVLTFLHPPLNLQVQNGIQSSSVGGYSKNSNHIHRPPLSFCLYSACI